jgi:putative tricarboxylic transport membrane protein
MRRQATLREADALSGAVIAIFGVFVLLQSLQLSFYIEGIPGPGFFPALVAMALIVLGAWLIVTRLRAARDTGDGFELPSRRQATRSLTLWGTVLAAALLVGPLGFPLAMLLLVGTILFVLERRRGLGAILTTVLIPILAWLLFAELLQVPLPVGPFGS